MPSSDHPFTGGIGVLALVLAASSPAGSTETPSIRTMLSVPRVGSAAVAPAGDRVAYTVTRADWNANRYDTEIFVFDGNGTRQLTSNAEGSSFSPSWSPDGRHLAFIAHDDGSQVFLIDTDRGTTTQLTSIAGGVNAFKWAPSGMSMALLLDDQPSEAAEERVETFGTFTVEGIDRNRQHLWLLDASAVLDGRSPASRQARPGAATLRRLTGGEDFTVGSFFGGTFNFTPDGRELLFDHAIHGGPEALPTQDISAVDIATGEIRPIVRRPGIDSSPFPSPDGTQIAFHTLSGPAFNYGRQYHFATVPTEGGVPTPISDALPDEGVLLGWYPNGILYRLHTGVETHVYGMDPESLETRQITSGMRRVHNADVASAGDRIVFVGEDGATAREVYRVGADGSEERLTDFTDQLADWPDHETRLIHWKTADDTTIEGVLYLPEDFARSPSPRPLLVLLHGGPSVPYRPVRIHQDVYPIAYWLDRGAVVLAPNYRGSGGYGDRFRAMNVRRLGAAYAEDVLSGIDHLVSEGIADPDRLGAMGWSAGGNAAAFLATRTDRFKAISVGAGIANLYTDYVSNDQPLKLREYLQSTPWDDPEIYRQLSPMTTIGNASTPTLIQHGRDDHRVTLVNAMEFHRGLRAAGVETRLIIYEGTGHVIGRPKERLAANEHNRRWFDAYLWDGGDAPDLTLEN